MPLFPTDGAQIKTISDVKIQQHSTRFYSCQHLQTLMCNHMHPYWCLLRLGFRTECIPMLVFAFFYLWIESSGRRMARNETPQSFIHGCPGRRPDHRNTFLLHQCKGQASIFMNAGLCLGSWGGPTRGHKWTQTGRSRGHEEKIRKIAQDVQLKNFRHSEHIIIE